MGIDSVALNTFNSTGSQSVCRANKPEDGTRIVSDLITKCTTKYMNGSGVTYIPGSNKFPQKGSPEVFYLPNDVDSISEIKLQMSIASEPMPFSPNRYFSPTLLLDLIDHIEIRIGGILFQKINAGDIYSRNLTENGNLMEISVSSPVTLSKRDGITFTQALVHTHTPANPATIDYSVSIPFIGRSSKLENSFMQSGARTNSMTIKVHYLNKNNTDNNFTGAYGDVALEDTPSSWTCLTGISVFTHRVTITENSFIQNNIINRILHTSQGVKKHVTKNDITNSNPIKIDLRDININVSHILILLHKKLFNNEGLPLCYATSLDGDRGVGASNLEKSSASSIFLTGTSWSANLGAYVIDQTPPIDLLDNCKNSAGVKCNWIKTAELVIGNDRTGPLPASCIGLDTLEQFNLAPSAGTHAAANFNLGICIIKLADSAFSTSGIPFSRLNNPYLEIVPVKNMSILPFNNNYNNEHAFDIYVTCCGTQVQSTVSGTTSLSA